jgi:hypothetical protein
VNNAHASSSRLEAERIHPNLLWYPQHAFGVGTPAQPQIYDQAYWTKYLHYDQTRLGRDLTAARVAFVHKYFAGMDMIDIGIGGGLFCRTMNCYGYDINPHAEAWLASHGRWRWPEYRSVEALSFWDSMEHVGMDELRLLINAARDWIFVSMPIYDDAQHCLRSKHFRPGEHVLYFTTAGLVTYMGWFGFTCADIQHFETDLGREDIHSFAFRRTL